MVIWTNATHLWLPRENASPGSVASTIPLRLCTQNQQELHPVLMRRESKVPALFPAQAQASSSSSLSLWHSSIHWLRWEKATG